MKKVIRLTESDLHRIVENSVKQILKEKLNEGQGWNTFKDRSKRLMNGEYDDMLNQGQNYFGTDDWKRERRNFINNGTALDTPYEGENYYNDEGDPTSNPVGNKPINNGVSGKVGRAAAAYGVQGLAKARQMYNKYRGKK